MATVRVDSRDVDGCKKITLGTRGSEKVDNQTDEDEYSDNQNDGEEYSESNPLLPPKKGEISRKIDKTRRKVQWNDRNGNKLVEVLEYEPSDVSDSEDEDSDSDSCLCKIM